jgi:TetR/AcrR family transcriptional regulator, mexCD-oprJ operon repressor
MTVPDQSPRATTVDHRRAIAERNGAAILDATERLLGRHAPLSMSAIAAEAGVSRPTLYAHFKTIGAIVEAAVERSVNESLAAIEAVEPASGPPGEALHRMAEASWGQLARFEALARGAAEHLSPGALHRTHGPLMAHMLALVERGRRDGTFRTDLPADWLVTMFYSLVHAADEHASAQGVGRAEALELLKTTVTDLFAGRGAAAP